MSFSSFWAPNLTLSSKGLCLKHSWKKFFDPVWGGLTRKTPPLEYGPDHGILWSDTMVHWIVTCWYDNPSLSWSNIVWPCLPWYNQVNQLLVCQAVIAMVWKYYCLDTCWHNAFYTVQLLHMLLWQLYGASSYYCATGVQAFVIIMVQRIAGILHCHYLVGT